MPEPILGVIADDFTGATDIGSMLVRGGLSVVQTIGPPEPDFDFGDANAVVVALKTRSIPAKEAEEQSLAALRALQAASVSKIQFKYCSTFDSTPDGNIGPVSEALAEELGCDAIVHIPSLPINGRTVFKGHLFVGDALLNESGMQNHPLNPMTEANLQRWLKAQVSGEVTLVDHATLAQGAEHVRAVLTELNTTTHVIGDAIDDDDLGIWSEVLEKFSFFAGGSGLAKPLAMRLTASHNLVSSEPDEFRLDGEGNTLILSGSCSNATLAQIEAFRCSRNTILQIDPIDLDTGAVSASLVADKASEALKNGPVLIHGSANPEEVDRAQKLLGEERAGALVEDALSDLAATLAPHPSVARIVVAGGETSGAVVSRLGAVALRIGAEIDPGVPWTLALNPIGKPIIPIALKSGNFGSEDFFLRTSNVRVT